MLCSALLNILRGPLEDSWLGDMVNGWGEKGLKKEIGRKKGNHSSSCGVHSKLNVRVSCPFSKGMLSGIFLVSLKL